MAKGFALVPETQTALSPIRAQASGIDLEFVQAQWLSYFQELDDPRGKQGRSHDFLSIVLIAILAVIGGATG
ncbi:MAG: transposase family protein [Rhizonema sp. PD37]|nr:transposase family protein [Rhizonema sp. PD37]